MIGNNSIYPSHHPSLGLVIGTYGSVPYIHLHLESWIRNCRDVPVLIHDDCSPHRDQLEDLCRDYGVDFYSNPSRCGHIVGDMMIYPHALHWAEERGLDILVKFSRRFVPVIPWQNELGLLAYKTQQATFSGRCEHESWTFRTDCVAMHVRSWLDYDGLEPIHRHIEAGKWVYVETVVQEGARRVHEHACDTARRYLEQNPPEEGRDGYAYWSLPGCNRRVPRHNVLWHECSSPVEYHRAIAQYGVGRYSTEDFTAEGY